MTLFTREQVETPGGLAGAQRDKKLARGHTAEVGWGEGGFEVRPGPVCLRVLVRAMGTLPAHTAAVKRK